MMAAYADRAHERERDLADIAHLLDKRGLDQVAGSGP